MSIADKLLEHAQNRPGHPAIEDGDQVVTYGDLPRRVHRAAANLQASGLKPGDVAGIMLPDSADHLIALYGLVKAGVVILSINKYLPQSEKESVIANLGAKAIIAEAGADPLAGLPVLDIGQICGPCDGLEAFDTPVLGPDDPFMFVQSSGTTGVPKTMLWSHAQMAEWIRRYGDNQGWNPSDRSLSLTVMSFVVGRCVGMAMLYIGGTVVFRHADTSDELVAFIRDKRITYLKLTPAHLRPLIDYAEGKTCLFPSLRAMVVGSAPTTHEQRLLTRQRLTPNLIEQFGINETGLLTVAMPKDQDAYPDAVGRLVDGIEAEVVDPEDNPLPQGEVGLIRFRGPGFSTDYLDDPEAAARSFRNGWFYPGDLAAINQERYVFFKGRADDVINNEGVKFYPMEIERVLLSHPNVTEAAAFGWPHDRQGEVVAAAVVTDAPVSYEDLSAFCRNKMAGYKVPFVVLYLEELPRNPMGKIVKSQLKETLRQRLAERERLAAAARR